MGPSVPEPDLSYVQRLDGAFEDNNSVCIRNRRSGSHYEWFHRCAAANNQKSRRGHPVRNDHGCVDSTQERNH